MHDHLINMDKPLSKLLAAITKLQNQDSNYPAALVCSFASANPTQPVQIHAVGHGSTLLQIILLKQALEEMKDKHPAEYKQADGFLVVELDREEIKS